MDEESLSYNSNKKQTDTISIILADDHDLIRQALRNIIEGEVDLKIVGEASDGEEVLKLTSELLPNVVIMDIGMPKLNGLEATRQIKKDHPNVEVLALTVYADNEHILNIFDAGASGYLIKNALGDEVIHAVRQVAAGKMAVSTQVLQQILKHAIRHRFKPIDLEAGEKLTPRDLEILKLLARGHSNREIAQKLGISLRTAKGYLGDIFAKMRVSSRTEAVVLGLRSGFITLEEQEEL